MLSLELTKGVAGAIPIAIVPFSDNVNADPAVIVANDLQNSGRFRVVSGNALTSFPNSAREVDIKYFRRLGTNNVVIGRLKSTGPDQYQLQMQLLDVYSGKNNATVMTTKDYNFIARDLRAVAHRISDVIYQQITGTRGVFSTKLAYVVIKRDSTNARYTLEIADQDGFNPRTLLVSYEPIMSPAWSPDGKKLAYVSFEKRHASIYIQDVASGSRRLISSYPGINGAPAWSPDGRKLAVVLSKSGSPNVYVLDVASGSLKQLTHDFYINTEPSWSPSGKTLLFTSNRGGNPQIYQMNLASGAIKRLTYDGDYNARGAYTRDGNGVTMIHRVGGVYNIGLLDLDSGRILVLTNSRNDSTSPSVAPNGSMVLYDTYVGNRSLLGMVSADAKVQLALPARDGDAQDPAWSPFLS